MCMALGLWEISNIMATFLRFDVKTKVEVVPASSDGLPFPAVTFCSSNIGLKSFLGGSPEQRQGMMLLMTRTTNILTLKQMSSTCEDPSVPKHGT